MIRVLKLCNMEAPTVPASLGYTCIWSWQQHDSPAGNAFGHGISPKNKLNLSRAAKIDHVNMLDKEIKDKGKQDNKDKAEAAKKAKVQKDQETLQKAKKDAVDKFKKSRAGRTWVKDEAEALVKDLK